MTAVLDASALLALLFDEPGAEMVADVVASGQARVSTVNLGEVATVIVRGHHDPAATLTSLQGQVDVEPFTEADARAVAMLYPKVSAKGLSLGDRACLALADRLDALAVTAEHTWADLRLDIDVQVIRPLRT